MRFLNKEYIKYHSSGRPWKSGLFGALAVFFVFLLFQPFGFSDKDPELKLILFPAYALLTYFYSVVNFFIVRQLIKTRKLWSVKNELLSFATGILPFTFLIHLLTHMVTDDMPLNLHWYLTLLYHVASLYLIIAVIEFLYYNNKSSDIKIEHLSVQVQLVSRQSESVKYESESETVFLRFKKKNMESAPENGPYPE